MRFENAASSAAILDVDDDYLMPGENGAALAAPEFEIEGADGAEQHASNGRAVHVILTKRDLYP